MADNGRVDVRYGADTGELEEGARRATGHVLNSVTGMQNALSIFTIGLGAALGGAIAELGRKLGETIREAMQAFPDAADEVKTFSNMMGISRREASVLAAALQTIGYSTGEYEGMVQRVTMRLRTNEQAFRDAGVATRDASGNLLSGDKVMQNAIKTLYEYKAGTDRNIMAMQLLGRNFKQASELIDLTDERMKQAEETATTFGLVMGENDVQAVEEFGFATNDLNIALRGFAVTLGRETLGFMMGLVQWARDILPNAYLYWRKAIEVTKAGLSSLWGAIKEGILGPLGDMYKGVGELLPEGFNILDNSLITVQGALEYFALGITVVTTTIHTLGMYLGILGDTAYMTARRLKDGNFEGVAGDWKQAFKEMERATGESFDKIAQASVRTVNRIEASFKKLREMKVTDLKNKTTEEPAAGGGRLAPTDGKDELDRWQKQLQDMKNKADVYRGLELEAEIAFWREKEVIARRWPDVHRSVLTTLRGLESQNAKQNLEESMRLLDFQIANARDNIGKQIDLQKQKMEMLGRAYGVDSMKYAEAEQKKTEMLRQQEDQRKAMVLQGASQKEVIGKLDIESAREIAAQQVEIGRMTAMEKFEIDRGLAQREYELEREKLMAEAEANRARVLDHQKTLDQIARLDAQYGVTQIKQAGERVRLIKQQFDGIFGAVTSAFDNAAKGIAFGTQTLRGALQSIGQAILGEFISMGVRMVMNWIQNQVAMTAATAAGATTRTGLEAGAAATSVLIWAGAAVKNIITKAWEAAASVYAAIAGIPFVGPFLAPGLAIGAVAAVTGYAANVSAQGGYDVPNRDGINARLHAREMVLPQELADRVRGMTGGGGTTINYSPNVLAFDGADARRALMKHGPALVDSLRKQARNFNV